MRLIGSRQPGRPARPGRSVSFREAVVGNLPAAAEGGGLYVPESLPAWPDVAELLRLPWRPRCVEILDRLLAPEYSRAEVAAIVGEIDIPVRLVPVGERRFALELFHGPSLAFKDFGAGFLAAVLERLPGEREGGRASSERTVLTATSGDTGGAVAAAFWRRPGFRVVVLYPAGRVSPLQERQLACLGENVTALAVAGTFDDCQRLVKACFADAALSARLGLVAANSINIARLAAQILYYFEAVAQLQAIEGGGAAGAAAEGGAGGLVDSLAPLAPVIAVPCGNFGNLCAGLYARALGLPVRAFVAATNANRVVPEYLDSGVYRPRPGVATLSNAMDVGDPSNWERILHLFGLAGAARPGAAADPAATAAALGALRATLRWGSLDDAETAAELRRLWAAGYQADPHGAVAHGVLRQQLRPGETGIFLATAHPAKFEPVLAPLGLEPELPAALRDLLGRPLHRESMPADEALLAARLAATWRQRAPGGIGRERSRYT